MPLTHHYKKCPVMWMIIGLISKNPEISVSSRNNPEMSQHSSDVSIDCNAFPMSETFKKSQMSEFFDVSAGCLLCLSNKLASVT